MVSEDFRHVEESGLSPWSRSVRSMRFPSQTRSPASASRAPGAAPANGER